MSKIQFSREGTGERGESWGKGRGDCAKKPCQQKPPEGKAFQSQSRNTTTRRTGEQKRESGRRTLREEAARRVEGIERGTGRIEKRGEERGRAARKSLLEKESGKVEFGEK